VVGFCGQAGGSCLDFARRNLSNRYKRLAYRLVRGKWEPSPFETTAFRKQILQRLERRPFVDTKFIIRNRYRAGYHVKEKDPFHTTRTEFIQNILETDYTVCMRGGGNFSARLYETLSLGRIPIYVDTDSLLPYDHKVDYKDCLIWIEENEIPYIAEKVADFHASLSSARFQELQLACRQLWVERLSRDGFYAHFHEHF
jgi:hypothetical protein